MSRRRIAFGVSAGMFSLAVDGLAGLLVYPLLLRTIGTELAGVWILALATAALLNLFATCFGPVISRRIAMRVDLAARLEVQSNARHLFVRLCGVVAVSAALAYLFYLLPLFERADAVLAGTWMWGGVAVGVLFQASSQRHFFALNGFGEVGRDKIARAIAVTLGFIVSAAIVWATESVTALAWGYVTQGVVMWSLAQRVRRQFSLPDAAGGTWDKGMLKDGVRILILNITAYLLNNFALYYAEMRHGLNSVAGYSAIGRVGFLLATVSLLVPQMMYPFVARAWGAGDQERARRYYLHGVLSATGCYVLAALPLWLAARPIFSAWIGTENFLGYPTLTAVFAYYLVYVHHVAHATPVLASGGADFVVAAVMNCVLAGLAVVFFDALFGIVGIPLGLIVGTLPISFYVIRTAWRFFARLPFGDIPKPAAS